MKIFFLDSGDDVLFKKLVQVAEDFLKFIAEEGIKDGPAEGSPPA